MFRRSASAATRLRKNGGLLYACNPMVGVIDGFCWDLLRGASPLGAEHLDLHGRDVGPLLLRLLLFPPDGADFPGRYLIGQVLYRWNDS
jgi:hypothetical protein